MSQLEKTPKSLSPGTPMRDFRMPAMPPLDLFAAVDRGVRAFVRRRRLARQLRCDAHLLNDIGHSDHSLRDAMKAPGGASTRHTRS